MGRRQEEEEEEIVLQQQNQKHPNSLRSKAAHFVSDLTTGLLNPISDKSSKETHDDINNREDSESDDEKTKPVDAPDTSSFTAFLYSLLASSESPATSNINDENTPRNGDSNPSSGNITREKGKKKSMFSRGKQSIGKALKFGVFRNQDQKSNTDNGNSSKGSRDDGIAMQTLSESLPLVELPETSEPSMLLSEKTRNVLYPALPVIVKGRKWMLLYSTWRHGISLSTLYRRSMIWPGLSLLVVGDRNGAVFGGLVEAPLKPINKRRYQGSNNTFVFTNVSGHPLIFRPTGVNRYFTLCSTDYLALGGGSHFALYLDGDLLSGSSSSSETYGNPCLARSEDFEVKEIELWGFVYGSKYEDMIASSQTEAPGICHW